MSKKIKVTVENKLVKEKRDIHLYHHSTRSAHIISYNSSIDLPLQTVQKHDYLHIALVKGPGNVWEDCVVHLPILMDFEFKSRGDLTFTYQHCGDAQPIVLKIPPGPPLWELKLMRTTDEESRDKIKVTVAEK
jgi:hypothetical protein